jgi:hypothetical protein
VGENQSQTGRRRLTVAEASEILGITVEAVRGRIKRRTLDHERTDKGVFVLLDPDQSVDRPRPDTDQTTDRLQSDNAALISAKDETIAALREQLEAERQAHSGARRLLMAALERIPPQLEAPQEAAEGAETVVEAPEGTGHHPAAGEVWDELDTERARREMAETTMHEGMAEERRRREEAERERDELRRELFARRDPREFREAGEEQQGRGEPRPAAGGAQEGAHRPWWRRMFRS